jgi:hypothetical protein
MPFDALAALSSSVLISRGRPELDLYTQLITATSGTLLLAAVSFLSPTVTHLAWTVSLGFYALRAAVATRFVMKVLSIPWPSYARALSGGAALGVLSWGAAGTANHLLIALEAWPRLLMSGVAALSVVAAAFFIFPRAFLSDDMIWLVSGRGLPIPKKVEAWLISQTAFARAPQ